MSMSGGQEKSASEVYQGTGHLRGVLVSLATFGNAGPSTALVQLQLFFTKFLGYDPVIVGNVRGFSILFDALIDPLMGYISDRTRTRFGRRMPYIAVGDEIAGFRQFAVYSCLAMVISY